LLFLPNLPLQLENHLQAEREALALQKLQIERNLGVLARRAATADYYAQLTQHRNSSTQTVNSWENERDSWHYKAANLIGRCPNSYIFYHGTYNSVFSALINPDRKLQK
jgi:hypothetical protein